MAIRKNPYDVGIGMREAHLRTDRCPCCGMPHEFKEYPSERYKVPPPCPVCATHLESDGEPAEQTIARLMDHLAKETRKVEAATAALVREQQALTDEKASNTATRDRLLGWREVAMASIRKHHRLTDGSCKCGVKGRKCVTQEAMRQANDDLFREAFREITRPAPRWRSAPWDEPMEPEDRSFYSTETPRPVRRDDQAAG